MIHAKDISFAYSKDGPFKLRCPEFRAESGKVTCIIGPNGSGKSTLLGILGGRIKSESGEIHYQGSDIHSVSKECLTKGIGWIDSTAVSSLVPEMLVVDHLALALLAGRQAVPFFHRNLRIENLLDHTRMSQELGKQMAQLSTQRIADLNAGARQALTIALALINPRNVILADEGTATLDIKNARHFFASMQKLTRSMEVAVVVVTHDVILAARYSDSIYLVKKGLVQGLKISQTADVDERIHALEQLFFDD